LRTKFPLHRNHLGISIGDVNKDSGLKDKDKDQGLEFKDF